uniref:lyase family protein n=1 Tax=Stenotrophomonas cyclobalanopsidis TaxID=2771362 RepID=UPI002FDA50E0
MSHSPTLLGGLFGDPAVDAVFSDEARLQAMLDVERALARAQVQCGVIPAAALAPIEAACSADLYAVPALSAATALAGNPAIPLVKALTAQVKVSDAEAARWVHWGATSQDIIDSGAMLQLRAAVSHVQARLQLLCTA